MTGRSPTHRNAEASLAEVAFLETTLRESATERRALTCQTCSFRGTDLSEGANNVQVKTSPERLDMAVADYGARLRSWVDQQVDVRINFVLQGFEGELHMARQESATALVTLQRFEGEVRAAAEAQSKLLGVVGELSQEVARLQFAVDKNVMLTVQDMRQKITSMEKEQQLFCSHGRVEKHDADIKELQRSHGNHDRDLAQLQRHVSNEATRTLRARGLEEQEEEQKQVRQRELFDKQLEEKLAACRTDLHAAVTEEILNFNLNQKAEERLKIMLENFRGEVAAVASLRTDVEEHLEASKAQIIEHVLQELRGHMDGVVLRELKSHVDVSQGRLEAEITACQQRLFAQLRAETTASFRSEAAAVAALDEQLWLTDQRLGQRIDEVAHLHLRQHVAITERRCRDVSAVCTRSLSHIGDPGKHIEERALTIASSIASPRGDEAAADASDGFGGSGSGAAGETVSTSVAEGMSTWWRQSGNDFSCSAKATAISQAAAERARLAAAAVSSAAASYSSLRTHGEASSHYSSLALTGQPSFCEPIAVNHYPAAVAENSAVGANRGLQSSPRPKAAGANIVQTASVAEETSMAVATQNEGIALDDSGGGSSLLSSALRDGRATSGALASWLMSGSTPTAASPLASPR
eukprot:TRINITY_DN34566_c0_g1_i1.p1 TRINITY_DN34566_c0_g1~~TRINITY_DN34566_c0_g1_i1.p1  ORF type:complete len:640 (-),score=136.59 TRINITY_DN34566_c0_g1_i1:72-1991(-)